MCVCVHVCAIVKRWCNLRPDWNQVPLLGSHIHTTIVVVSQPYRQSLFEVRTCSILKSGSRSLQFPTTLKVILPRSPFEQVSPDILMYFLVYLCIIKITN